MNLNGLFVPLVTPFEADGSLAAGALLAHGQRVLDAGATGLVALGTTAEPASLTPDERREILNVLTGLCRERDVPLIAGAGTNDTMSTVAALDALGEWADITAALVSVPYFTRPSEDGVVAHFAHLAARRPVPLVVYNIPYRTGRPLTLATLRRLSDIPGVVGIKHAVGGVDEDTVRFLGSRPEKFAILAGDDVVAPAMFALGADGAILASANVYTSQIADLVRAWRDGDVDRARIGGHFLSELAAALFAEPNPVVVKAVLHAQGLIPSDRVRLPLLPASNRSVENVSFSLRGLS